jgi:uncharacterized phiE125 gp8 family phage protein
MYKHEIITPPLTEPLTLAEIKQYLRIAHTVDDNLLTNLGKAARKAAENYLSQAILHTTYRYSLGGYVFGSYHLPFTPMYQEIEARKIDNAITTIIPLSSYKINASGEIMTMLAPIDTELFQLDYIAGIASTAASVPDDLRLALLLHIRQLYSGGNNPCITVPAISREIYDSYRKVRI